MISPDSGISNLLSLHGSLTLTMRQHPTRNPSTVPLARLASRSCTTLGCKPRCQTLRTPQAIKTSEHIEAITKQGAIASDNAGARGDQNNLDPCRQATSSAAKQEKSNSGRDQNYYGPRPGGIKVECASRVEFMVVYQI